MYLGGLPWLYRMHYVASTIASRPTKLPADLPGILPHQFTAMERKVHVPILHELPGLLGVPTSITSATAPTPIALATILRKLVPRQNG